MQCQMSWRDLAAPLYSCVVRAWRNGRRTGLKIRCSERDVSVRLRPGPPRPLPFWQLDAAHFPNRKRHDSVALVGDLGGIMKSLLLLRAASFALVLGCSGTAPVSAQIFGDNRQIEAVATKANREPLDDLVRDVEHMHPVAMFVLAKRMFDQRRGDDATFWLYEGELRWKARLAANSNLQGPFGEADRYQVFSRTYPLTSIGAPARTSPR